MDVNYQTYRQWEVDDSAPSTSTLKAAIRKLQVPEWEKLVLWLADGQGTPPWWLLTDEALDLELLRKEFLEETNKSDGADTTVIPMRRLKLIESALPWRSIETLAQQARAALARQDARELAAIEAEFRLLLRSLPPETLAGPSAPSQDQQAQPNAASPPAAGIA